MGPCSASLPYQIAGIPGQARNLGLSTCSFPARHGTREKVSGLRPAITKSLVDAVDTIRRRQKVSSKSVQRGIWQAGPRSRRYAAAPTATAVRKAQAQQLLPTRRSFRAAERTRLTSKDGRLLRRSRSGGHPTYPALQVNGRRQPTGVGEVVTEVRRRPWHPRRSEFIGRDEARGCRCGRKPAPASPTDPPLGTPAATAEWTLRTAAT